MKSPSTAILLFTRSAEEEAASKRVSVKKRLNQRFFNTLITHSYQTAQASGLPLFTADHQQGNSFGERLSNAIRDVFDEGYERVITIGNDAPGLTTQMILNAANQLDQHKLVLGPAKDGGTYLIGLHRSCFDQHTWAQFDWSGANSFDHLLAFAHQHELEVSIGRELVDIDNRHQLHLLLRFTGAQFQQLKQLVVSLLTTHKNIPIRDSELLSAPLRFAFGLKAPPLS